MRPLRGVAPHRSMIGPVSKSRDLGRESGRASPAIPHWNFCRRRSECHTTTILGGNYLRRKVFSDVYSYYDQIKLLAEEIGWVSFEFSLLATAITRNLPAIHPLLHLGVRGWLHHALDPYPNPWIWVARAVGRRRQIPYWNFLPAAFRVPHHHNSGRELSPAKGV